MAASFSIILFGIATVCRIVPDTHEKDRGFAGDTLICFMDIRSERYEAEDSGFNYAMADMLEEYGHCTVHIVNANREPNGEDSLFLERNGGGFDIIITNMPLDSLPPATVSDSTGLLMARMPGESVWISDCSDSHLFRAISGWIAMIKSNGSYDKEYDNFFNSAGNGKISPYDSLIKHYARRLGWDWKLLCAIIHSESMFINGTSSHRGAMGLMQVRPETGAAYGIYDLSSPANNIDAGTRHLRYLKRLMLKSGITDSSDLVKFTLAAYNAGEGRIEDCRALAAELGRNPDKWEDILETIPLMSDEEYYSRACIKRGRFNGRETVDYVEKVLAKYEEYSGYTKAS